jgi:ankyrin repeat protein
MRGMTELHFAAYCNDADAVLVQLQSGFQVDVRDDNGWTPLLWSIDMAQAWGDPERVVSILLGAGASPNAVDRSGFSVLMMACARNNGTILADLLKAGADIHLRNTSSTPLHEAAGGNFSEGIRTLLLLGADPSQKNSRGLIPEEVAEECGFEKSVAVFRAAGRMK